jgi:starch synthase
MKVLYVASEAYPLAKVGGLGDVAGALPTALRERGVDVRLMLPAYPSAMATAHGLAAGPVLGEVLAGYPSRLHSATMPGTELPLWLVDCPRLYAREGGPYHDDVGTEWPDNHLRFGLLARACASIALAGNMIGWRPDIVHANDWQTGLVPFFLKSWHAFVPQCVFTVHNMAYQGLYDWTEIGPLGVPMHGHRTEGIEFWGRASFLKAGLAFADRITTVSPTYAREIQRAPLGEGLEGLMAARAKDTVGILNGIDDCLWNPATDEMIERRYAIDSLDRKGDNTAALRSDLGLEPEARRPLLGMVSRLATQKGVDILLAALPAILAEGCQIAVLGEGDQALELALCDASRARPQDVAVRVAFDETRAHRMIAGCDMIAMPSRFEPCGTVQLLAQRYGTLPVAREVGGLADTIRDGRDGFTFAEATPDALVGSVRRAVGAYRTPALWRRMQRDAMAKDLSWTSCTQLYVDLYRHLLFQLAETK